MTSRDYADGDLTTMLALVSDTFSNCCGLPRNA